jgi:hypothetical protein
VARGAGSVGEIDHPAGSIPIQSRGGDRGGCTNREERIFYDLHLSQAGKSKRDDGSPQYRWKRFLRVDVVFSRESLPVLFRPPRKVYLFHGEDDYQKEEALHHLRREALDETFADFDSQTIEAQSSAPEEILAAAGLAPFASSVRLVVVTGAGIYRRRERAEEADRLSVGGV